MSSVIRVLIVDDHDMLREGLASFLRAKPDLELIGEASTGAEAIALAGELQPDVLLIDLLMPETDGVTAIRDIHTNYPDIRIIALSSFSEARLVKSAIEAGAHSYLLKNVSADTLAESIRIANVGIAALSPEIAPTVMSTSTEDTDMNLTNREWDVLHLMIEGFSNAEIAYRLSISKFTVKNHVSNILSKLNVSSRTEAVRVALQSNSATI